MSAVITLIAFLVMLGIIVTIHEFGHFIVAKLHHIYVYEFSIGMGPKIFQKKGKETVYSLRALPLGGYCAMAGEDNNENIQDVDVASVKVAPERNLNNLAWYKQIQIMFAGPFMNFVLAFVIFCCVFASLGYTTTDPLPVINEVRENSPADLAGLQAGDYILKVEFADGSYVEPQTFTDIVEASYYYEGESEIYTVDRDGETLTIEVTPKYDEESGRYLVGISSGSSEIIELKGFDVIKEAGSYFMDNTTAIFKVLGMLVKGRGYNNLSGPIGIYQATDTVVSYGFTSYLLLIGVISLNLGIMNLIPLPIFDGGRIVIALAEGVVGHPLSMKVKNVLMGISLGLLALLLIVVAYNDISKVFG